MSEDLVSVIIPVFNGARFLAEAVASVRMQRQEDIEIIVVDDGSTDGSFGVASRLDGVACLRQENAGPATARNTGVREARGSYLAFLDADDLWTEGKLKGQLEVFRSEPGVQLVAGCVEEFYAETAEHLAQREQRGISKRAYTVGALLIRRDDFHRVGWFNPALRFGEFIDWRSRAMACGMKERMLDTVVLRRRIHDQNTTRLSRDFQKGYLATVRAHLERKRAGGST